MTSEDGTQEVTVRSLTIPDLQRSVMNTSSNQPDPYQDQYQYVATAATDAHQLYDQLVTTGLRGPGTGYGPDKQLYSKSQALAKFTNGGSVGGGGVIGISSVVNDFSAANGYLKVNSDIDNIPVGNKLLNGRAMKTVIKHNANSSTNLTTGTSAAMMHYSLNDTTLDGTLDASTVLIHHIDASSLLHPLPNVQSQLAPRQQPNSTGDNISSLHIQQQQQVHQQQLIQVRQQHQQTMQKQHQQQPQQPQQQQQQQILLCNSNPNLSNVESFSRSFRRALLPEYRPAPDYHSVVQHKRELLIAGSSGPASNGRLSSYPLHNTYSTPDLHSAADQQQLISQQDHHLQQQQQQHVIDNGLSSPSQQPPGGSVAPPSHPLHGYRPPPPYPRTPPYTKSTSTSSPDLMAAATDEHVSWLMSDSRVSPY